MAQNTKKPATRTIAAKWLYDDGLKFHKEQSKVTRIDKLEDLVIVLHQNIKNLHRASWDICDNDSMKKNGFLYSLLYDLKELDCRKENLYRMKTYSKWKKLVNQDYKSSYQDRRRIANDVLNRWFRKRNFESCLRMCRSLGHLKMDAGAIYEGDFMVKMDTRIDGLDLDHIKEVLKNIHGTKKEINVFKNGDEKLTARKTTQTISDLIYEEGMGDLDSKIACKQSFGNEILDAPGDLLYRWLKQPKMQKFFIWKTAKYITPFHQDSHDVPHWSLYSQVSGTSIVCYVPLLLGLYLEYLVNNKSYDLVKTTLHLAEAKGFVKVNTLGPGQVMVLNPYGAHAVWVPADSKFSCAVAVEIPSDELCLKVDGLRLEINPRVVAVDMVLTANQMVEWKDNSCWVDVAELVLFYTCLQIRYFDGSEDHQNEYKILHNMFEKRVHGTLSTCSRQILSELRDELRMMYVDDNLNKISKTGFNSCSKLISSLLQKSRFYNQKFHVKLIKREKQGFRLFYNHLEQTVPEGRKGKLLKVALQQGIPPCSNEYVELLEFYQDPKEANLLKANNIPKDCFSMKVDRLGYDGKVSCLFRIRFIVAWSGNHYIFYLIRSSGKVYCYDALSTEPVKLVELSQEDDKWNVMMLGYVAIVEKNNKITVETSEETAELKVENIIQEKDGKGTNFLDKISNTERKQLKIENIIQEEKGGKAKTQDSQQEKKLERDTITQERNGKSVKVEDQTEKPHEEKVNIEGAEKEKESKRKRKIVTEEQEKRNVKLSAAHFTENMQSNRHEKKAEKVSSARSSERVKKRKEAFKAKRDYTNFRNGYMIRTSSSHHYSVDESWTCAADACINAFYEWNPSYISPIARHFVPSDGGRNFKSLRNVWKVNGMVIMSIYPSPNLISVIDKSSGICLLSIDVTNGQAKANHMIVFNAYHKKFIDNRQRSNVTFLSKADIKNIFCPRLTDGERLAQANSLLGVACGGVQKGFTIKLRSVFLTLSRTCLTYAVQLALTELFISVKVEIYNATLDISSCIFNFGVRDLVNVHRVRGAKYDDIFCKRHTGVYVVHIKHELGDKYVMYNAKKRLISRQCGEMLMQIPENCNTYLNILDTCVDHNPYGYFNCSTNNFKCSISRIYRIEKK